MKVFVWLTATIGVLNEIIGYYGQLKILHTGFDYGHFIYLGLAQRIFVCLVIILAALLVNKWIDRLDKNQ
jgi:hypothetical protein